MEFGKRNPFLKNHILVRLMGSKFRNLLMKFFIINFFFFINNKSMHGLHKDEIVKLEDEKSV